MNFLQVLIGHSLDKSAYTMIGEINGGRVGICKGLSQRPLWKTH